MASDTSEMPAVGRREWTTIGAITATFGLLLTLWACMTPMFQAPDESTHYNSIVRLATGGGWPGVGDAHVLGVVRAMEKTTASTAPSTRPTFVELQNGHPGTVTTVDQMTQHPPTYYAVGSVILRAIHFGNLDWDVGVILIRLFDVLLVTSVPLLVWATVRRLTRSPKTALVAAMTVFLVPQLASIGSSVTSDAPIILAGGLTVWLGARILTGDLRWRTLIALGLVVGVACSTKGTALPLLPFVALVTLLGGWSVLGQPVTLSWGRRAVRTVVAGAIVGVLGSAWWIHNVVIYGSLQPSGLDSVRPDAPFPAGQTPNFGAFFNTIWNGLSGTFWGQFGKARFPMTPIVTDTLTVLVIFAIVAYGFRRTQLVERIFLALLPAIFLFSLLTKSWATYADTQGIYGVQGRYLFPTLVAGIALSAFAWKSLVTTVAGRQRFGRIAVITSVGVGLYGFTVAYRAFYEQTNLGASKVGIAHLFYVTPVGRPALAILIILFVIVGLCALTRTYRALNAITPPVDRVAVHG